MDIILLYQAYKRKDYNKFLELFNEYLEKGYGVDIPLINTYIVCLTKIRKYDEGCRILKNVEKDFINNGLINTVLNDYIRCFKLEEAERIINENGIDNIDQLSLIELYLLEGKIEEAKLETKIIRKNNILDEKQKERLNKYEKTIYNYEYKNGLIETEYSHFLKNGNELEVGHIIFLKQKPEMDYRASQDDRAINRSYMIWKIEGEKLYLFPVSGVCKKGYRLIHQKYPNSMGDRVIKNNSCTTYKDNVLSVKDKVLSEDLKLILKSVYDSLYFGYKQYRNMNEEFINYYIKKPECFDVIELAQKGIRQHRFYLVLEANEETKVIEIDFVNKKIIGLKREILPKDTMFYNVIKIDKMYKDIFKEQLEEIKNRPDNMNLIGKITTVNGEKLIIIDESENNYYCINKIYSKSLIMPVIIEKEKVKTIEGSVSKEELEYIRVIISEYGYNPKKCLKQAIKK